MGIEAPIPISMKLGNSNDLFYRITDAAQRPHLSIPVTEAGKNRKRYRQLVKRSLVFVSGMPFHFLILICHFLFASSFLVDGYCKFVLWNVGENNLLFGWFYPTKNLQ